MENRNFMTLTEDELYEVNGGMTEEDAGGGNLQSAVGAGGPTFVKIVVNDGAAALATEKKNIPQNKQRESVLDSES